MDAVFGQFQPEHSAESPAAAEERLRPNVDQLRRLLDAVMVVGSQLSLAAVLLRIIETATEVVGAQYGALGVLDETGTRLDDFITVGIDDQHVQLIGALPEGHGILGMLIVSPVPLRLPDLSAHPERHGFPANHPPMSSFLGVPVLLRNEVYGNLYFSEKIDGQSFTDVDEELAVALAAAAALAIENDRLNERKKEMSLLRERERIARELHDDVIQRVFAAGLSLHVTSQMSTEPEIVERLIQIGADLDLTIREVRTTIFGLNDQSHASSLCAEIVAVCGEATPALGFDPSCQTRGPIDSSVPPVMAGHIALILREALSNVARHARATQVDVLVMVENHRVVMEVTDDGIGFTTAVATEGNGLANMRTRASAMDGTFTVDRLADGGTKLVWQAPLTGIGAG